MRGHDSGSGSCHASHISLMDAHRDLDEHDIVSRIMRKDNYLIALINKEVVRLAPPPMGQAVTATAGASLRLLARGAAGALSVLASGCSKLGAVVEGQAEDGKGEGQLQQQEAYGGAAAGQGISDGQGRGGVLEAGETTTGPGLQSDSNGHGGANGGLGTSLMAHGSADPLYRRYRQPRHDGTPAKQQPLRTAGVRCALAVAHVLSRGSSALEAAAAAGGPGRGGSSGSRGAAGVWAGGGGGRRNKPRGWGWLDGRRPLLTKTLEWNLRWWDLLFSSHGWALFSSHGSCWLS